MTINETGDIQKKAPEYKQHYSRFPIGAPRGITERYGEYGIAEVQNIEVGDEMDVFIPTDTKSYTLKAPMMQRPTQKQDSFFVPMMAIIPESSDYIQANPLKGDDVPKNSNTVCEDFENNIRNLINEEKGTIDNDISSERPELIDITGDNKYFDNGLLIRVLRLAVFIDQMYNPGNLLTAIGRPMFKHFENKNSSGQFITRKNHDEGRWFDKFINDWKDAILANTIKVSNNEEDFEVVLNGETQIGQIDLRTFIYKLRDSYSWYIADEYEIDEHLFKFENDEIKGLNWNFQINAKEAGDKDDFNYERAIAYQLVCAHFYTNNKVDYIYTARLWRQNLNSLLNNPDWMAANNYRYNMNGIEVIYDATAGIYMNDVLNSASLNDSDGNNTYYTYEYFRMLFGWNNSLRFVDYFTGARTEPLAVGDTEVAVNDGAVNVVDVVERIQKERYLAAINKVGATWEDQQKELYNIAAAHDWHDPLWLAHTKSTVGESTTENTADDQYTNTNPSGSAIPAITGNFEGNNRFGFNGKFDRKGILIVIRYYDIPRLYYEGIDTFTKKATRFDMYNPMMQYIGDQEIWAEELDMTEPSNKTIFGYTGRDMEYKTAYGKARGGFIFNLPGYAFLADLNRPYGPNAASPHIGPSYIRSLQTELDPFYQSLTGYSLDSYFHFIVMQHTIINAKRKMTYNPQILQ